MRLMRKGFLNLCWGACVFLAVQVFFSSNAWSAPDPERGKSLIQEKSCLTCHSVDDTLRNAPPLAGLAGRRRRVVEDSITRELVADEAYIKRSILHPVVEVVEGYLPGSMPHFPISEKDAEDMTAAIMSYRAPGVFRAPIPIWCLLGSALLFVGIHLGLSFHPVRSRLVSKLSSNGFQGLYSLLVLGAFIMMIITYRSAPYIALWPSPQWTRYLPNVVMPIAFVLLVLSVTTKNPTTAGQEAQAQAEPVGIVKVTRHPMLWGIALWGLAHLPPNGDARSAILFGSLVLLSLLGMLHIDARRKRALGDAWNSFASKTSLLPFGALLSGRAKVGLLEIGLGRIFIGLILYAIMIMAHKSIFGLSALP